MSDATQGRYPIARRAGEIERLDIQGEALAADAGVMLDLIGVAPGWRCLDLGCGPGGIMELMSARVGAGGRVIGLDRDGVFLDHARRRAAEAGAGNIELVAGDVYASGLPAGSFDLVHSRFVASTAGQPERLLAEMIRLARPGGTVALQEPDITDLSCTPVHPAFERLKRALDEVFQRVGANVHLGRDLDRLLRGAGLGGVQTRPFRVGFGAGHAMADYVPATAESLRGALLEHKVIDAGELDAALAQCRAHLAQPDTRWTYHTVVQAWGRTQPAGTKR